MVIEIINWHSHFRGQFDGFLTKLSIDLTYNLVIMFLDIFPKELETYVKTKVCTRCLQKLYSKFPNLGRNQDAFW